MRVPQSEYEALLAFAEPVSNDRHNTRPAGRLNRATEKLKNGRFALSTLALLLGMHGIY